MKFEIEFCVFNFLRLHAPLYLHPILPLSNSCPASDGSLHVWPVLFPRFPITARADARAHVCVRTCVGSHRKARHAFRVARRSSWRGRETEKVDSAMRTALDEETKIAKRDREKWERGEGRNTSARRSKNSPLLPLILLSFSLHSLLSILAKSRPRTLCRKRRDELEWGRGSGNLRLDDYRSIDSRIDRHPSG